MSLTSWCACTSSSWLITKSIGKSKIAGYCLDEAAEQMLKNKHERISKDCTGGKPLQASTNAVQNMTEDSPLQGSVTSIVCESNLRSYTKQRPAEKPRSSGGFG